MHHVEKVAAELHIIVALFHKEFLSTFFIISDYAHEKLCIV